MLPTAFRICSSARARECILRVLAAHHGGPAVRLRVPSPVASGRRERAVAGHLHPGHCHCAGCASSARSVHCSCTHLCDSMANSCLGARSWHNPSAMVGSSLRRSACCGMTRQQPPSFQRFGGRSTAGMKDRLFSKSCVAQSSLCYALCSGGFISKNIAVTCAAPKLSHSMPSTGSHEGGLVRFDTINCSVMFGCHAGTALPGRHAALRGVNSQTAEQFFSWCMDPFVRSVVNMTPAVFEVFLLLVAHFYNTTICASVGPSARVRAHRPRPAPSRRARNRPADCLRCRLDSCRWLHGASIYIYIYRV